jgi:hypothetical protein
MITYLLCVTSLLLLRSVSLQTCFQTQFPQLYGGTCGDTIINGMDVNPTTMDVSLTQNLFNDVYIVQMIFCGRTSDYGLVSSVKLPNAFAFYML